MSRTYLNDQGNNNLDVRRVYYTGTTALTRGAVLYWGANAAFTSFTKGPGIDVQLTPASPVKANFAGILCDGYVGSTGGWIDIIVPHSGDVVWCKVAAGTDVGDGVLLQEATSAATQGFSDSGAYAAGDLGVLLADEDAASNPHGDDNLAPVAFGDL